MYYTVTTDGKGVTVGGGGMRTPQTPANPSGPVYDMLFSMLRRKLTYCLAVNSSEQTVYVQPPSCWLIRIVNFYFEADKGLHFNNVEPEKY